MKRILYIKIFICLLIIILLAVMMAGCWNYREIDDLAIVAGVAIDYAGEDQDEYELTIELVNIKSSGSNQSEVVSEIISDKGMTIFDAIRNMISVAEKKLYWSHSKVFIISRAVAEKSIIPIVDWIFRDAETRQDMLLLMAKEGRAGDILRKAQGEQDILSVRIYEMVEFQEQLSKAPIIPFWKIAKDLNEDTVCSAIPMVTIEKHGEREMVRVGGTAVLRNEGAVGELSEEETKYYLFAKNQVKGGILPIIMRHGDKAYNISLEIYDSKTTLKFDGSNKNQPVIHVKIETKVFLGEVDGNMDPTEPRMLHDIEKLAEEDIEKNVEKVCHKVLREFRSDIFGFAKCIKDSEPKTWKEYSKKYEEIKPKITVKAEADVKVILSGLLRKEVPVRGE